MIESLIKDVLRNVNETVSEPTNTVGSEKKNCGNCLPMGKDQEAIAYKAFGDANKCAVQMLEKLKTDPASVQDIITRHFGENANLETLKENYESILARLGSTTPCYNPCLKKKVPARTVDGKAADNWIPDILEPGIFGEAQMVPCDETEIGDTFFDPTSSRTFDEKSRAGAIIHEATHAGANKTGDLSGEITSNKGIKINLSDYDEVYTTDGKNGYAYRKDGKIGIVDNDGCDLNKPETYPKNETNKSIPDPNKIEFDMANISSKHKMNMPDNYANAAMENCDLSQPSMIRERAI